jgi:hypothetical protein
MSDLTPYQQNAASRAQSSLAELWKNSGAGSLGTMPEHLDDIFPEPETGVNHD